ncbi:HAMP domain-containing sensor histidine kinase [Nocardioides sp.]|uniref:HAMP domain-containing sensor histidine kinase n=1 Tax=Nocardioides sp. TaxID=35761 RepID=UPI00239FEA57|nr:HAMP domain-containing sensor histidine kinase [Nocardioides sp.]MDE0774978.1 HAMP domain-containing sensor histidine kinase [Nocardioides sp.]
MRSRILTAILSVSALAVLLFGVPLAIVVDQVIGEDAALRVERAAVLASRVVPGDFATGDDPVELPPDQDGIAVGLYDRGGNLVTGTGPARADDATRQALLNRVIETESQGFRVVTVPVAADEQVVGVIRAQQPTADSAARTRRLVLVIAALAVLVLAIGAGVGFVLANRLTRPVRRLRDAAVHLGDGDFTIAVPASRIPELDQAAVALTVTAGRLDALVTRERSFSSDASHQLRTPLTGLRASIETELAFPRSDRTAVLTDALVDLDRLERTITEILSLSRSAAATTSSFSLPIVMRETESVWRDRLRAAGRALSMELGAEAPPVLGNAGSLRQALDVLLDNALAHGQGRVTVSVSVTADSVTVAVSDEGTGFIEDPTEERGSATRSPLGHGLGLPLAQRLLESISGRLVIRRSGPRPEIALVLQRAHV